MGTEENVYLPACNRLLRRVCSYRSHISSHVASCQVGWHRSSSISAAEFALQCWIPRPCYIARRKPLQGLEIYSCQSSTPKEEKPDILEEMMLLTCLASFLAILLYCQRVTSLNKYIDGDQLMCPGPLFYDLDNVILHSGPDPKDCWRPSR